MKDTTENLLGIVIQARVQAQRLPEKTLKPFYGNQSILELIIQRLRRNKYDIPVYVATTDGVADDAIVDLCDSLEPRVMYFRGSEENVLDRFAKSSKYFRLETVIRVCADNPLIDLASIEQLIEVGMGRGNKCEIMCEKYDYLTYGLDVGDTNSVIPSIKSHCGFFAELIPVSILECINEAEKENITASEREHVTMHLYTHPERYLCRFLPAPVALATCPFRKHIRLTVDTEADFQLVAKIYQELSAVSNANANANASASANVNADTNMEQVIACLANHPRWLHQMQQNIMANQK